MQREKSIKFLEENKNKFNEQDINFLKLHLEKADEKAFTRVTDVNLKSPGLITAVSVFIGYYGIDRFLTGDYLLGIIKLFTLGGFGILWFIDFCQIGKIAKYYNAMSVMCALYPGQVKLPTQTERVKNYFKMNKGNIGAVVNLGKGAVKDFQDSMYI